MLDDPLSCRCWDSYVWRAKLTGLCTHAVCCEMDGVFSHAVVGLFHLGAGCGALLLRVVSQGVCCCAPFEAVVLGVWSARKLLQMHRCVYRTGADCVPFTTLMQHVNLPRPACVRTHEVPCMHGYWA
jgi:hypothetical protein